MTLPINKSKLPGKIKGEALIDLITKTGGEHGSRPKKSEVKKFFKGTEVNQKPYAHISRERAAKELKRAYEEFGIKESGKQALRKEVNRIQTEQQSPKPVKKSSEGGFLSGLLGRKKATPSGGAFRLSEDRRRQGLPPQPPIQPPAASQKPPLQPTRHTPSMKV